MEKVKKKENWFINFINSFKTSTISEGDNNATKLSKKEQEELAAIQEKSKNISEMEKTFGEQFGKQYKTKVNTAKALSKAKENAKEQKGPEKNVR